MVKRKRENEGVKNEVFLINELIDSVPWNACVILDRRLLQDDDVEHREYVRFNRRNAVREICQKFYLEHGESYFSRFRAKLDKLVDPLLRGHVGELSVDSKTSEVWLVFGIIENISSLVELAIRAGADPSNIGVVAGRCFDGEFDGKDPLWFLLSCPYAIVECSYIESERGSDEGWIQNFPDRCRLGDEGDTVQIFYLLLAAGLDINATDSKGRTCLHHWVMEGDPLPLCIALAHGADVSLKDQDGERACDYQCFTIFKDNVEVDERRLAGHLLIFHENVINAKNARQWRYVKAACAWYLKNFPLPRSCKTFYYVRVLSQHDLICEEGDLLPILMKHLLAPDQMQYYDLYRQACAALAGSPIEASPFVPKLPQNRALPVFNTLTRLLTLDAHGRTPDSQQSS